MESQQLTIKGRNNTSVVIEYTLFNNSNVLLNLKSHNKEDLKVKVHVSLFAVLVSILQRVLLKWDGVVLVTGDVGDGKTTIAQLVSVIWEWFFNREQDLDLIVWTSESFTSLVEKEDNETGCILWDEAIQGGTGRDSITKQGQALKKAFVTKRYKMHLYLLLVDEIQEYNKKIISRCRAWIHVYTKGLERGYFKIFNDKTQIKRMYRKIKKFDLELEEVMKTEKPAFNGYQADTSDLFYCPDEYKKRKSRETNKEDEKENKKVHGVKNLKLEIIQRLRSSNSSWDSIGEVFGVTGDSIRMWHKRNKPNEQT